MAREPGRAGLALITLSIACTVAVGAAGPSLMEPVLPGGKGQPPWTLDLHLNPYAAVGLAAAGLALGTVGLVLALRATRAGWAVNPRLVLLIGVVGAAVVSQTGPFGTSDFLSYAAYGRELVTGYNPYVVTPETLARLGDPVARAVQDWAGTPSVYGALANGVFGLASLIGGTSARLTVWVLDVVNAAAFVGTGLLLDRLVRAGRLESGRLRAALLWTCNPLLLQILVAGAHIDALAVFFGVAGIAVLASGGGVTRGVVAGALVGCGFAVKPTVILVAIGLLVYQHHHRPIDHHHRPIVICGAIAPRIAIKPGVVVGFLLVAGADLVVMGSAGLASTLRASGMVSVGSPWRVVRTVLSQVMAESAADEIVRWCAVLAGVLLAVVLLRRLLPRRPSTGRLPFGAGVVAFALVLAWLVAWPYVLPWYDALAWALLPMLPASRLDWLLLARMAVLGVSYLPARVADITIPGGLRWMEPVLRSAICPLVLAGIAVTLVIWAVRPARLTVANRT